MMEDFERFFGAASVLGFVGFLIYRVYIDLGAEVAKGA